MYSDFYVCVFILHKMMFSNVRFCLIFLICENWFSVKQISTSNYPYRNMIAWHFDLKFMFEMCSGLCLKSMLEYHRWSWRLKFILEVYVWSSFCYLMVEVCVWSSWLTFILEVCDWILCLKLMLEVYTRSLWLKFVFEVHDLSVY